MYICPQELSISFKNLLNMSSFWQNQVNEILLLLITFSALYILSKRLWKNSRNKSLPSPPKLPILGNLHQLSELLHRSLHSLGMKYGPVMLLHLGNRPVLIVQSADTASELLKTQDLVLADKAYSTTSRRLFYDLKDVALAPYGEYWRKLKSICVVQLLSGKRVQSYSFIREEETTLLMKKIGSSHSPVNLSELFGSLAYDVICRAAFGRKYNEGEEGMKFVNLVKEHVHLLVSVSIGEFVPWLSWINRVNGLESRVDKVVLGLDGFLELILEQHLSGEGLKDGNMENFVDILLNIYNENSAGVPFDKTSIKAIILDMLVGGTDTTSTTLEWAMTELLRHPAALKKLQTEVREIMEEKQGIIDRDLEKMKYLKAVVKETLRFHPPIPIVARIAREDVRVMGQDIAGGTMVLTNVWAIGRDPASWDDPQKFIPERFLNSPVDFKGLNLELIPFGTGRRICPGIAFAVSSVELVLANLVHKFEWGLPQGIKTEDLDTTEQPGGTVHRKYPLLAVATRSYM